MCKAGNMPSTIKVALSTQCIRPFILYGDKRNYLHVARIRLSVMLKVLYIAPYNGLQGAVAQYIVLRCFKS